MIVGRVVGFSAGFAIPVYVFPTAFLRAIFGIRWPGYRYLIFAFEAMFAFVKFEGFYLG